MAEIMSRVCVGSRAAVDKAYAMVDEVLNPTYECKEFMDIGVRGIPIVLGPKGSTIRGLQESSGTPHRHERVPPWPDSRSAGLADLTPRLRARVCMQALRLISQVGPAWSQ